MMVLACSQDAESFKTMSEGLEKQIGQIYIWEPVIPDEMREDFVTTPDPAFDRAALNRLKARMTGDDY